MDICNGTRMRPHSEIVHNERYCPLCQAMDLLDEEYREIERLNNQNKE